MDADKILDRVRQMGGRLVEITGGEPLLQKDINLLTERLLAEGYRVLVETSGERFIGDLPQSVVKIVDVKCPGSGESEKFCYENLGALERKDQVKFVILDKEDYAYACDFLIKHDLHKRVEEVIFSPVFGRLLPVELSQWILRDGLEVRLGLQIHKFIWRPDAQGV